MPLSLTCVTVKSKDAFTYPKSDLWELYIKAFINKNILLNIMLCHNLQSSVKFHVNLSIKRNVCETICFAECLHTGTNKIFYSILHPLHDLPLCMKYSSCPISFLHQFSCKTHYSCAKSFILSFSLIYVTKTFVLRFKPFHNGTSQVVYNCAINVTHTQWYLSSRFFMIFFFHFIITIKRKSSMDSFYLREKANILISTSLLWVN